MNFICRSYIPQPLWDDLYAGKVDIATLFYDEKNRPKEMQMYDIDYISMIAMLREDNPLCEKEEITFKELSEYPLIQLKDDPYSRQITEQNIKASGVEFKNMIQADNIEMVPMVVRKTGGVHITGESCRKQNASKIQYRRIKEDKKSSVLGFCSMIDNVDPLVQLFFEELKRKK